MSGIQVPVTPEVYKRIAEANAATNPLMDFGMAQRRVRHQVIPLSDDDHLVIYEGGQSNGTNQD